MVTEVDEKVKGNPKEEQGKTHPCWSKTGQSFSPIAMVGGSPSRDRPRSRRPSESSGEGLDQTLGLPDPEHCSATLRAHAFYSWALVL